MTEKAKEIIKKQFPKLGILTIRKYKDFYIFEVGKKGEITDGAPFIKVDRDGKLSYITVPPISNLKLIDKGKVIYNYADGR